MLYVIMLEGDRSILYKEIMRGRLLWLLWGQIYETFLSLYTRRSIPRADKLMHLGASLFQATALGYMLLCWRVTVVYYIRRLCAVGFFGCCGGRFTKPSSASIRDEASRGLTNLCI